MKATLLFLILVACVAAQQIQPNPAIRITSNATDLNRWFADHLNVLSYVDMPLPDQSWKFLGIGLFSADHLRLRNVSAQEIQVDAVGNNRVRFTIMKSVMTVDFHTKIGLISSSGEVHFNNNSLAVIVQIDSDNDGKPIVKVESMAIALGVFNLKLNIGHSLWNVINTALPLIRSWVEDEIPNIAVPYINNQIDELMNTFGTILPIDQERRVGVDISYFSKPILTNTRVQFEIKGIPYVNGFPFRCPYVYGQSYHGNNDVNIFTDINFLNCMTAAAAKGDILNEFLANFTVPAPLTEPISLNVKLYADQTVLKMKAGTARGSVKADVSLFRSTVPKGTPYLVVGLGGNAGIDLSFEGSNFTDVTVHGYLRDIQDDLSILSFNGDKRAISTDLKLVAKQLSKIDELVNQKFVETVKIPYPPQLSKVPLICTELFQTLNMKVVDGGIYVGIDYRV